MNDTVDFGNANGGAPPQQLKLTEEQVMGSPSFACPECGHEIWMNAMIIKEVSQFIAPSGRAEIHPCQTVVCQKCGTTFDKAIKMKAELEKAVHEHLDKEKEEKE
jgi:DNA-directed RNA polymerase subunit RPC12/RpoP